MFTVHFNKIVTNLKELNVLAGEDEARISHTVTGAKLKFLDPIPLTVYQNGFLLFSGPFRPYSDPLSQRFIQDIMDGYFPSELQDRYPDGVPITLTDKREVIFRDRRHETAFPGSGEVLGGEAGPSHLITTGQLRTEGKKTNGIKETNEPPGGIVPVDNFLDRLPRSVVKNGKVIDIRSDISQQLKHRPGSGVVSVVDTPAVQAIRDGRLSDKDITTLRVKSEGGDKVWKCKTILHQDFVSQQGV
ncbi:UBX domain-containing protein 11-like isoform X2 [Corticium candelabrum]|uniref:UBX domain-containing protein 11-like isoform X2 n=1 Tax=Corticium candelabrum TaxID=121492 RepID=UPI002E26ACA9|nr:UBX domain-containing protein 11-like isoform X2 [Corticium candelabrum]